tara:strand:+ start:1931 stop:2257 length:327 start_codon:yes stop_codon:yes gene_type:complete
VLDLVDLLFSELDLLLSELDLLLSGLDFLDLLLPELFELGALVLLPDRVLWVLDTESRDLDLVFPEDSDLDFEGDGRNLGILRELLLLLTDMFIASFVFEGAMSIILR